jgi:hypothetical protein
MLKIYRESFAFFLSSLPALLLFAAVIEGLLWFLQPRSESSVTFVALTIVAYYIHRHFLFGERLTLTMKHGTAEGAPPMKLGWFILLSAALLLVPIGVALVIAVQFPDPQGRGVMVLVLFPIYLLVLSLFGTALPATVARDGTYRLSQGLRATFKTMWRLLLGPGVIGLMLLAATIVSTQAMEALGTPEESLILLAYYTVLRTLGFLTTIFAVAVLCEMYRRTRPAPYVEKGPGPIGQTPA